MLKTCRNKAIGPGEYRKVEASRIIIKDASDEDFYSAILSCIQYLILLIEVCMSLNQYLDNINMTMFSSEMECSFAILHMQ